MNYYESVVVDYLRADRSVFVNTECCIQLNPGDNPDTSGPHWYCDAAAVDFRSQTVFLCEISYSAQLADLTKRLKGWHENWTAVRQALVRDSHVPESWPVRPWLFVPEKLISHLCERMRQVTNGGSLNFTPRITPLEMVQPWLYRSFNRFAESAKPASVPTEMQF